ncbi:MAG: sel1 repeat family protein [Deltaproteobacteria bacterium]|jgi:TPR repeat protein|nr:sel1 repeat family protein [Deltaproteobacteria bacterium]
MAKNIYDDPEDTYFNNLSSNSSGVNLRVAGMERGVELDPNAGFSGGDKVDFKSLAAKIGKVQAMYKLGVLFHEGAEGVKKDLRKSMKWILKALENDYPPAMSFLGSLYAKGDGVTVNKAKALELWNKAMVLWDCEGCCYLSMAYYEGDGVIKDRVMAGKLWLRYLSLAEQAQKEQLGLVTIH